MKIRLLICCIGILCDAGMSTSWAYMHPIWDNMVWRFDLSVTRKSTSGNGHGYPHFIGTAESIRQAHANGVIVFGDGYGSSVWDISLQLKVDGTTQVNQRFSAPGDGQWHWSNQPKKPQQGTWRNVNNPDEYRYHGHYTNDTLVSLFIDGGWAQATGGEPGDHRKSQSAYLWVPGMTTPRTNITHDDLREYGWAGRIPYGLDPLDLSRWGIPKRGEFWVRAWMFNPQFLNNRWYAPFYWNRDGHAQHLGGNPYEGVSVYYHMDGLPTSDDVMPSGKLTLVKSTQHIGLQVGIRAVTMNKHDQWMIFRRHFVDGEPDKPDAAQVGYIRETSQAFFADKRFGTLIAEGTNELISSWIPTEFISNPNGLTRYYLVMHGNSDWGWYRVVDVADIRPYEINANFWIESSDVTCDWVDFQNKTVPLWRTRVDKGFTLHVSVIDASLDGPDIGDQHIALRALHNPQPNFAWTTGFWLNHAKEILQSAPFQESMWEQPPNPPLITHLQKGLHKLIFIPSDLLGTVGVRGRFGFSTWRQFVRTIDHNTLDPITGIQLEAKSTPPSESEIYIDIYPFATATATLYQSQNSVRTDHLDAGTRIDLGSLAQAPHSLSLAFSNPYPIGGLYLFITTPGQESFCLHHNFNNTSTAIGSADIANFINEPGDYALHIVEYNPFDTANLSDLLPTPTLPRGSGEVAAGYFAPYNMNMGWRKLGEYRFSIANKVRVRGMLIGNGLVD